MVTPPVAPPPRSKEPSIDWAEAVVTEAHAARTDRKAPARKALVLGNLKVWFFIGWPPDDLNL